MTAQFVLDVVGHKLTYRKLLTLDKLANLAISFKLMATTAGKLRLSLRASLEKIIRPPLAAVTSQTLQVTHGNIGPII